MLESEFQSNLIRKLKKIFKGCLVKKQETGLSQGLPDLLILYKNKWAMLECKKSSDAAHRPNQDYYVNKFNEMSFARFIFPENEDEVIEELKEFLIEGGDYEI